MRCYSLSILAGTLGLAIIALTPSAQAQSFDTGKMSTVRFRPVSGPGGFVTVEGARVHDHGRYSLGSWLEAGGPMLQQQGPDCAVSSGPNCSGDSAFASGNRSEELDSIPLNLFLHLNASFGLFDRAQLALDLPVGGNTASTFSSTYTVDGQAAPISDSPAAGFALGDPRLLAKVKLWGEPDDMLAAAATTFLTVPLNRATGNDHYTGERTVQAGGNLIGELRASIFRVALNVGAYYRPERTYLTASTGSELSFGIAAEVAPNERIAFTLEGVGGVTLVGPGKNPGEVLLGMHVGQWNWRFHLGGGVGLTDAVGTPGGRGFVGISYTPAVHDADHDGLSDWEDQCPNVAEDRDGDRDDDGCPEQYDDGDGIPEGVDQCPNEPEDMDDFEDEDGCPDPDNDGDGVEDGYDSCPNVPEDIDGDRDDDGCPDDDSDRDGIPDALDACPDQPEDTDGLGDDDGCPDVDYDRDGIEDEADSCPEQPELYNGIEDEDGCPEEDQDGDGTVDAKDSCPTRAETLNGVSDSDGCPEGARRLTFERGRLVPTAPLLFDPSGHTLERPRTFVTLDTAVEFVGRHHQAGNLAVVVRAPIDDAVALVQGETVRAYLIKKGIAAERVHVDHELDEPYGIELELVGTGVGPRPAPKPRPAKAKPAAVTPAPAATAAEPAPEKAAPKPAAEATGPAQPAP